MKWLLTFVLAWSSSTALAADPFWAPGPEAAQGPTIQVWRSESCGCCKAWIEHLEAHRFSVIDTTVADMTAIKDEQGVPVQARSCHTARIGDLVIEGHVPAQDIKRALAHGDVDLLAVPGMPSGSPGMDMAAASNDAFSVFAVSDNEVSEFNRYSDY